MKSQLQKLNPWIEVENDDDDQVYGRETRAGFVTRQPLVVTTEFNDDSSLVIPVCRYDLYLGMSPELALRELNRTGMAIPIVVITVPGMCGHYHCGGDVTVGLN